MNFTIRVSEIEYNVENDIIDKTLWIVSNDDVSGTLKRNKKGNWTYSGTTYPPNKRLTISAEVIGKEIDLYIEKASMKDHFLRGFNYDPKMENYSPNQELTYEGDIYLVDFIRNGDTWQVHDFKKKVKD